MDAGVTVKVLPRIQCGRGGCTVSALSGNPFCCEHLHLDGCVTSARRDQSIWIEIVPGVFRRKSLYPVEYERG